MAANVEVWVVVDEDGEYRVGLAKDEAVENYTNDFAPLGALRVVCVKLAVPCPKPVEITGTVPEEESPEVALTVA